MGQLQEVEQHIVEGDVEALNLLVNRLQQSSDFDTQYEAATLLGAYGFLEQAEALFATLLFHFPEEAQLKIDRANALMELGQEDEALLLLTDVQSTDEEYIQALLALADYYHMTGMAETAIDKVEEALALAPEEPVIRFAYAELLLDAGRFGEAARLYLQLKKETDQIGDVSLTARLAETYSAGAAYEKAIPYYEELLQQQPLPDTLFSSAFAYYQVGNAARALALLKRLIDIDPDYYSAYMLAGQAKALTGDDKASYEMFLDGIGRDEFDKELQLSAGKAALKLGRVEEAEQHLKEALALDPEYIEALITLASLYNEKELDEQLTELLDGVPNGVEEIPLLQAFLAYAFERTEQYKDAYEAFVNAYNGMKDDYEFLAKYANFLMDEGRRHEAFDVAERLVKLFPEDQNWRAFLEAQTDEEV